MAMKEIFKTAQMLGHRCWNDQGRKKFTEEQFEKHLKKMAEKESKFWAGYEGKDEIKEKVDCIIKEVEKSVYQ